MKNIPTILAIIILSSLAFCGFFILFQNDNPGSSYSNPTKTNDTSPPVKPPDEIYLKEDASETNSHKGIDINKDYNRTENNPAADSPLSIYPGFRDGPREREKHRRQQLAEEREREMIVAECMRGKGFQYTPGEPIVIRHDENYTTQELIEMLEKQGPDDAYLDHLSKEERIAYNMALYGIPDPNAEDAEAHKNANPDACHNLASRKIPGIYAIAGMLADERRALDDAITSDARIEAALHEWSRCMEAKGFQYESPDAIIIAIQNLEYALGNNDPDKVRQQIIDKFNATMTAGKSCDQEVGLSTTTKQVTYEQERRFVEEHYDLLEKSRDQP